uniref:Uncharacterized protein n=1 Tax=viral metagenome TaxID=1070528 RepID=A0A6C0KH28_9ZZZZ
MSYKINTQNELLLNTLQKYYSNNDYKYLDIILPILNGESNISLRLIDWFVTNYAKKHYTVFNVTKKKELTRFKVFMDYKLKLKAYKKKRFDPFCRWERITIPYRNGNLIQTTLGQLNFFHWALENEILDYIVQHKTNIENDMNKRNSTAKIKNKDDNVMNNKTRKKRHELSISATKSIKKEEVEIIIKFN